MSEVLSFDPKTGAPLAPGVSAVLPKVAPDPRFPMILYHQDGRVTQVENVAQLQAVVEEGGWEDTPAAYGIITAPDAQQMRQQPQVRAMGTVVQPQAGAASGDMTALGYVLQQWETRIARIEMAIQAMTDQMHSDSAKLAGYLGAVDVLREEVTTLQAWVVEQGSGRQRQSPESKAPSAQKGA